jgi:hypothetical protein
MSEEKKQGIPKTDDPSDIIWERETEGGIGFLGIDGAYAARRAAAWERLIAGTASDEDKAILAGLWKE